jgi:hypothetical protein
MSYFTPLYGDKHTELPGFGTIYSHSVGSTSRSTGFDHYFLPAGAEKEIAGSVRFAVHIEADGKLAWRFMFAEGPNSRARSWRETALTEATQIDFPPEVIAEMRRISETLYERDPVAWFYQAIGEVEGERGSLLYEEEDLVRRVGYIIDLLADPAHPTKYFVPAYAAENKEAHFRPTTPAEHQAGRTELEKKLLDRQNKLTELRSKNASRIALLTRLRDALKEWAARRGKEKSKSPMDFYMSAITEPA